MANPIERNLIIEEVRAAGLCTPVQILPKMLTAEDLRDTYVSTWTYKDIGEWTSIYESSSTTAKHKTQKLADDDVTCSCGASSKDWSHACPHIGDFCVRKGLPVPGDYFSTARRLDAAFVAYPSGEGNEFTKRNRAYRTMGKRVKALAYELCKDIKESRPRKVKNPKKPSKAGRPPMPLAAVIYCLIVKVAFSQSYDDVRNVILENDPHLPKLDWPYGVPNWNTLCDVMGDPIITAHLDRMIVRTSNMGRAMDYALILDGSGFGTTSLRNWRSEKYGKGKKKDRETGVIPDPEEQQKSPDAKWRKSKGFLKVHTAAGAISGLIYAIETTLNWGKGSSDNYHFESLVKSVFDRKDPKTNFSMVVADKGYYDKLNFAMMQEMEKMLFILPKRNTNLENVDDGAELMTLLDLLRREHPEIFRRFYRMRAKIEGFFSAQKRKNGYIRTKIRLRDLDRMIGLRQDPPELPKSAEKVPNMLWGYKWLCRLIAMGRVSTAHANEARIKAVAFNLRRLSLLKKRHGVDADLDQDIPFIPIRRVSLP